MLGPEGVARALVNQLYIRMPGKLAELRARLGVDAYELPDMKTLAPTEIDLRAVNDYPALSVVEYDTTGRLGNQQIDMDAGYEEYIYRYRMRVYVWVMADGKTEVDLQRKRLVLAVREILLQEKVIHSDDAAGQYAQIDLNTLKESFSDVGSLTESQLLGGAYIEVEVPTQERLAWLNPGAFDAPATISPGYGVTGQTDTHPVPQETP